MCGILNQCSEFSSTTETLLQKILVHCSVAEPGSSGALHTALSAQQNPGNVILNSSSQAYRVVYYNDIHLKAEETESQRGEKLPRHTQREVKPQLSGGLALSSGSSPGQDRFSRKAKALIC